MAGETDFKRAVRAVWDEVRAERRTSRKHISAAELTTAAEHLRSLAQKLDALAGEAPHAEASPAPAPPAKPKRKAKPKRADKPAKKAKKKKAE